MTQGSVKNGFVLVNVQLQETFLKGAWLVQRAETATRGHHVQARSTNSETVWVMSSALMLLLLLLLHPLPLQGRHTTIFLPDKSVYMVTQLQRKGCCIATV